MVSPCVMHPGNAGTVTVYPPSSKSGSRIMVYFLIPHRLQLCVAVSDSFYFPLVTRGTYQQSSVINWNEYNMRRHPEQEAHSLFRARRTWQPAAISHAPRLFPDTSQSSSVPCPFS